MYIPKEVNLSRVAHWIECPPVNRRVTSSIYTQDTAWVAGQVPSRGRARDDHTLLFPSLPLSLKINKQNLFLKKSGHHDQSSYHLTPYRVMMMLLIIFPVLHLASLWLIYFLTGGLYLLFFLFRPSPQPASSLVTISLFSISISVFLFCFVCLF